MGILHFPVNTHSGIAKTTALVQKALPDLLIYFKDAWVAVENSNKLTKNKDALKALYLASQWNKAVIKSKVTSRKKRAIKQWQDYLELAELFIGEKDKYRILKEKVTEKLDQVIQVCVPI